MYIQILILLSRYRIMKIVIEIINTKNYNINEIILVGGYHRKNIDHSKSEEYIQKVKEFFENNNYIVETRIDGDPDDDFIFMCNAKYFVPSGGTYSLLIM